VICRVCGGTFLSTRFDAITCSSTCRQRLRRGQAFAYLANLSLSERRAERKWHRAHDARIAAEKRANAAQRELRDIRRRQREERRAMQRKRAIAEALGMQMLEQMGLEEKRRRRKMLGSVAAVVGLFAKEGREIAAQAIADFLNMPQDYPCEAVAEMLDELKADGEYDRIVAEGLTTRKGD
jgi:hypothetical protein